jgi:hypothetical protein
MLCQWILSRLSVLVCCALWLVMGFALPGALDAQEPPTENLKLWLDAGKEVLETGGNVASWLDQSGSETPHDATASGGSPVLETFTFPSEAELPVIRFDGSSGFELENDRDMDLPNLTIYAVAATPASAQSKLLIANYVNVFGYGLGLSDGVPGRVKWFTAGPGQSHEPTPGGDLQDNVPVILTASHDGTEKRLYVNRQLAGNPQTVEIGGPSYNPDNALTVGYSANAGGQFWEGFIAEILVYDSVDDTQRQQVEDYLQSKYFSALDVTGDPEDRSVAEGDPVEFRVGFIGVAPFEFQWLRDGAEISRATENSYSIDHVLRGDDGARFSVRVTSIPSASSKTSGEAVLTVIDLDNDAIELVGAKRNIANNREVIVEFSEAPLPVTAADPANYAIDNGVTVDGVSLSDSPQLVFLATSPIEPGRTYTLTINGVQDRAENSIAPDTRTEIEVIDVGDTPPTDDLVLWLAADRFVEVDDEDNVVRWTDLAGGDNNAFRDADFGSSFPTVSTNDFPAGDREVIVFDGDTGMGIENQKALSVAEISMYAVFPISGTSGSILSNYSNAAQWGFGWVWRSLSKPEGNPTQLNLFTSQGTCGGITDPASDAGLLGGGYQILAATISNEAKIKRVYSNGSLITEWRLGNQNFDGCADGSPLVEAMTYSGSERAAIGTFREFGIMRQHVGGIAEILVYSAVDEDQRAGVEEYLRTKYFAEEARAVFRRGDWDGSGAVDITDSLNRLGFLFLGTTPTKCDDAGDFDNSGAIDISDSLNELTHLFLGTVIPPPPGTMACGPDPLEVIPEGGGLPEQVVSTLGCVEYPNADIPGAVGCP